MGHMICNQFTLSVTAPGHGDLWWRLESQDDKTCEKDESPIVPMMDDLRQRATGPSPLLLYIDPAVKCNDDRRLMISSHTSGKIRD